MSVVAIIPARWGSTRFPGKPLHPILGKPLLQHVWERCLRAKSLAQVIIATDDMRIAETAFDFGAEVTLTSAKHPSGTDRLAEVAANLRSASHIINVQGDEPAVHPRLIDRLSRTLTAHPELDMVTAASPMNSPDEADNPNCVKVVTSKAGRALYFSRSRIPYDRNQSLPRNFQRHIGIYGYRRKFLAQFVRWKPTPLEQRESLEQLRALEHGASIQVLRTTLHSPGVDTPEDVLIAEAALTPGRKPPSPLRKARRKSH